MSGGRKPMDLSKVDRWAVETVVSEGIKMNLSEAELVLATRMLRERGFTMQRVAAHLRVSLRKAETLIRRAECTMQGVS